MQSFLTVISSQTARSQRYFTIPLTTFDRDKWWGKLTIFILFLSIGYSFFISSIWLIVISFAKMEISFKRTKYRMDTFYVEECTKALMLIICLGAGWYWAIDDNDNTQITSNSTNNSNSNNNYNE